MVKQGFALGEVGRRQGGPSGEGIGCVGAVYLPPAGRGITTADFCRIVRLLALDAKELKTGHRCWRLQRSVSELYSEVGDECEES